jgi:hypothetical protein
MLNKLSHRKTNIWFHLNVESRNVMHRNRVEGCLLRTRRYGNGENGEMFVKGYKFMIIGWIHAGCWWLTRVILATQKAEIRRISF